MSDAEKGLGEVPAGGEGADSGAVDATRISPDQESGIANVSSQNDVPGVGTRGSDEEYTQDGAAMDQHPTTDGAKLRGIVAQTRADLPDASEERVAEVVGQRLTEAGVDVSLDEIEAHLRPDA